jgi:molybdenum cofactor cytidylyltransferase
MNHVAVIVLAAGRGTRFGPKPKLLAPLNGKTVIRHVVEAAFGSIADPAIVVTGHQYRDVETELSDLPVQIVRNAAFNEGLSTSLKAGFAALPAHSKAAIVVLGDMPFVTSGLINRLVEAWNRATMPAALVPTINGKRGNPVVLSRRLESLIAELSGDVGAVPILRERPDILEYPVDDPAILKDVDTSEGLIESSQSPLQADL